MPSQHANSDILVYLMQLLQQAVTPRGSVLRVGSSSVAAGLTPSASLGTTSNRYSSINRLLQRNGLAFKLPQRSAAGVSPPSSISIMRLLTLRPLPTHFA